MLVEAALEQDQRVILLVHRIGLLVAGQVAEEALAVVQPRDGVLEWRRQFLMKVAVHRICVEEDAHEPDDLAILVEGPFVAGDVVQLALDDALADDVLDGLALMQDIELVEAVSIVVDVPVHVLVGLAHNFVHGLEAIILQEGLRRTEETALLVFPEIAEARIALETLPEQSREILVGGSSAFRQQRRRFDPPGGRQHERMRTTGKQDGNALAPFVFALAVAHAEPAGDAAIWALADALDDRLWGTERKVTRAVFFVDEFLRDLLKGLSDIVGNTGFAAIAHHASLYVEQVDRVLLEVHDADILEDAVEVAQIVVELALLQALDALRDVLELDVDQQVAVHRVDDAQSSIDVVAAVDVVEGLLLMALARAVDDFPEEIIDLGFSLDAEIFFNILQSVAERLELLAVSPVGVEEAEAPVLQRIEECTRPVRLADDHARDVVVMAPLAQLDAAPLFLDMRERPRQRARRAVEVALLAPAANRSEQSKRGSPRVPVSPRPRRVS